jgi:hypothetical protein
MHSTGAHAHGNTAAETTFLVAAAAKIAVGRDLSGESEEVDVGG